MQLVDKQDGFALGLADLLQYRLQPFLEFAPVLGAGNQRTHIQAENPVILQRAGHISPDDPQGKPLRNGGFAYAGLTDQHRVVLGLPGKNPDDVPDLIVPADHRVQLVVPCQLHQILAVFFQHVVGALRVVAGNLCAAPDGLQHRKQLLLREIVAVQQLGQLALGGLDQSQEQMFDRYVFILHPLGRLFRCGQCLVRAGGHIHLVRLSAAAGYLGQLIHQPLRFLPEHLQIRPHLGNDLGNQAILLGQQRQEQMRLVDLLIAVFHSQTAGTADCLHGFLGEFLCIHKAIFLSVLGLRVTAPRLDIHEVGGNQLLIGCGGCLYGGILPLGQGCKVYL